MAFLKDIIQSIATFGKRQRPSGSATNTVKVFADTDGILKTINDAGTVYQLVPEAVVADNGKYLKNVSGALQYSAAVGSGSSNWADKKWASLGDSITYFDGYQPIVKAGLGLASYTNLGISGSTISNDMCNRYTSIPNDTDLITVFGGTNDYNQDKALGSDGDTTSSTFYGSLKILIEGLMDDYPNATILFFTPTPQNYWNHTTWDDVNGAGVKLSEYVNAIIAMCNKYSVPVLDLFRVVPFNDYNYQVYTTDKLHFTAAGYQFVADKMIAFINTMGSTTAYIGGNYDAVIASLTARIVTLESSIPPESVTFTTQPTLVLTNADGWTIRYTINTGYAVTHKISTNNGSTFSEITPENGSNTGEFTYDITGQTPPATAEVKINVSTTGYPDGWTSNALSLSLSNQTVNVALTDVTGGMYTITESSITKSAVGGSWTDWFVSSSDLITNGKILQFKVGNIGDYVIGISSEPISSISGIIYSVYVKENGTIATFNGSPADLGIPYTTDTVFKLEFGAQIKIYADETLIATWEGTPSYPYDLSGSIYSMGNSITMFDLS